MQDLAACQHVKLLRKVAAHLSSTGHAHQGNIQARPLTAHVHLYMYSTCKGTDERRAVLPLGKKLHVYPRKHRSFSRSISRSISHVPSLTFLLTLLLTLLLIQALAASRMISVRVRVRVRVSIGSLAHDVDASREQLEEHVQLQGMCRAYAAQICSVSRRSCSSSAHPPLSSCRRRRRASHGPSALGNGEGRFGRRGM